MRRMAMLLALTAAGGCDGLLGPGDPVSAYVRVENQDGQALRPDVVMWYYDPQSEQYDGEHFAKCLNRACTVWGVPPEVTGTAYVSASRIRPYPGDAYCQYSGYDAGPVVASEDDPPTITLRLDTDQVTCE